MNSRDTSGDYWTQHLPDGRQIPDIRLTASVVDNITPLDPQFGIEAPKGVPDDLVTPLFGQSGDGLDLLTYIILDPVRVPGLLEQLETSGLERHCLFQGKAYETLADVAPWVVQLEARNRFTRQLMTRSSAPWHLWDHRIGIYLRSAQPIDAIRRHFRKFTKVQDDSGKWYFWRFWEGAFLLPTLQGASVEEQRRFFMQGQIAAIHVIAGTTQSRLVTLRIDDDPTAI